MIFEGIDARMRRKGFIKQYEEKNPGHFVGEDKYGVSYERWSDGYEYTQVLDIMQKESGEHLIQSYQKGVNSDGFNNVVGLTYEEMKLAMKKYRQMKRRYKWK